MTRRPLGLTVSVLVVAVTALVLTVAVLSASGRDTGVRATLIKGTSSKPNILFIVTDDQRSANTLDVMPYTRHYFKSQGVYFPNAVATDPSCCPSRASIFSGRYNHNNGVHQNTEPQNLDQNHTLQHYLQQNGYQTAIYGKFLNDWVTDFLGNPPYWDKWAIFDAGYTNPYVNDQGNQGPVPEYSTTYVADKAVSFLKDSAADPSRPWFLYVAPFPPHSPEIPESKYQNAAVPAFQPNPASWEADRSDKPPWVQALNANQTNVLNERIAQYKTLYSADDLVRRVMKTLDRTGQSQNTLAVFMSDNGWMWGEHALQGKGKPYLDSVDIPFYVRWPGHATAGATDERLAANIDLAPTALDVAGATPDIPMDGKSLFSSASINRSHILTEFWSDPAVQAPDWFAEITPAYHYIETYDPDRTTVTFREYYDLANDPYELTNLLQDGNPNNDPPVYPLSAQVNTDKVCSGASCP